MNAIDLDQPLIVSTDADGYSVWSIRQAIEGVQILGGIGSGKTSGSGRMLALKYLKNGFGGLVLTVKPDEKDLWVKYCQETGRMDDLVIIEPGGKHYFNFLDYEATKSDTNQAITANIVEVLKTVIRVGEEKDSGKGDDAFWESALDMLIYNVIDLCQLAYGTLSLQKMYEIVQSLPKAETKQQVAVNDDDNNAVKTPYDIAYENAHSNIYAIAKAWYLNLSAGEKHAIPNEEVYNEVLLDNVAEARLLKFLHEFFEDSFKNLSQKTRSIIEFIFAGFLFRLLREPVYSLFCRYPSTVVPEDCLKGKIIVIDLPIKKYHKVGRDCQILFKYIWQRAMERRVIQPDSKIVFLWADEAQNFIHEHDADFQATARSSRIATVYITQNLPNYYAAMGGAKADYRVKSFLGTLATKIFHANADIETNKYGSELIGDGIRDDRSKSVTIGTDNISQSESISLKLDRLVRPEEFMRLQTGGKVNQNKVEGYLHVQGHLIHKGKNHKKMKFNQNLIP